MAKTSTQKGNYYKKKTQQWFQAKGYETQLTEFVTTRPIGGGKVIYVKKDVYSSDGISMNGDEIIFWNSKATTEDRQDGITKMKSEAKIAFEKHNFPKCVKRQAIVWLPRIKEPYVFEFNNEKSPNTA